MNLCAIRHPFQPEVFFFQSTFQYLIEADGDKRWGGVFEGAKDDGLTGSVPSSQKPKLLKKFDTWDDSNSNFLSSNPYVVDCSAAYFTTALKVRTFVNNSSFSFSPSPNFVPNGYLASFDRQFYEDFSPFSQMKAIV